MQRLEQWRLSLEKRFQRPVSAVAALLHRLDIRPNHVTWTGMVLTVSAAGLLVADRLLAAGVVFVVAGILDMLDGALARTGGRVTAYGAFLDSTLDRVGEGAILAAVAFRFAEQDWPLGVGLVVAALLLALLVSYTRARAEGLGIQCRVGLLTRAERVILLALGMFLDRLDIAVYLLVLLGSFTVIQRVRHVRRQLTETVQRRPQ